MRDIIEKNLQLFSIWVTVDHSMENIVAWHLNHMWARARTKCPQPRRRLARSSWARIHKLYEFSRARDSENTHHSVGSGLNSKKDNENERIQMLSARASSVLITILFSINMIALIIAYYFLIPALSWLARATVFHKHNFWLRGQPAELVFPTPSRAPGA